MDTWESFFREKSRRRSRRRSWVKMVKAAIVALLLAEAIFVVVLLMR